MNILGFIIGTAILWLLTALVVNPLALAMTNAKRKEAQFSFDGGASSGQAKAPAEISTGYFVLADVLVLGIAGFLLGRLSGWFFIGITWQAKSWPGMIAFTVTSIAGSLMHG